VKGLSAYLQNHDQVRSLVGLCRVAAVHFVGSTKARERRIEFRGLNHEIEGTLSTGARDWQDEVDLWIWVDQVLQYHDREIRLMLRYRLLEKTWDHIGQLLGMSGGQARLRFRRALQDIRVHNSKPDRGRT
jgi:hypothetical protein